MTDEDLFKKYLTGDASAFEILYRRHAPRVFRLAQKYVNERSAAETIVSAVFSNVHQLRLEFDPAYRFIQWLFVLTRRELTANGWISAAPETLLTFADTEDSEDPFQDKLDHMMDSLDEKDLGLLHMRFVDGLAFEELSERIHHAQEPLHKRARRWMRRWSQKPEVRDDSH